MDFYEFWDKQNIWWSQFRRNWAVERWGKWNEPDWTVSYSRSSVICMYKLPRFPNKTLLMAVGMQPRSLLLRTRAHLTFSRIA